MALRLPALLLLGACAAVSEPKMVEPRYDADSKLIRPEGYREWMFVSASLGMGYREGAAPAKPTFHSIYIQPEAYRQYAATGAFPDKTMLVMEVRAPGTNLSINKHGQFADRFVGFEVALKDEKRFAEKWAYFDFSVRDGQQPKQAKAFPKDACWKCHNEHGATDNVFVQFYPVLREARK